MQARATSLFIESEVGLNGIFKVDTWTPLSVRIENRGKLTTGTLDVIVRSGNEFQNNIEETVYSRNIELTPNSTRIYDFFIFIQTVAHPLRIRLSNDFEILREETLSLRTQFTEKKIVLVSGDRGNSKFFTEIGSESEKEMVKPLFLRPGTLPRNWIGFDGVETVMLQTGVLKFLSKVQLHALAQWVRSGGFLLLTSGIDYSFFEDETMKSLIDIEVIELQRVSRLNALEAFSNAPFVAKNPFLILNTRIRSSRILLEEGRIPLVVEKSLGNGKIIFFAFNFQSSMFQDWSGNLNFWQWLEGFRPPAEPSILLLPENQILLTLIESLSPPSPEFISILMILILYVIGIRIFQIQIRNSEDSQKLMIPLVVFLLCFTAGSASYYHFKQADKANHSSFTLLTKKPHSAFAYLQQWITVYSFHRNRYHLESTSVTQPIRFLESSFVKNPREERFTLEQKNNRQVVGIPLRRWSHQVLTTREPFEFPLQGTFWQDQGTWTFVLENKTELDFKKCWIFLLERLIPIEDLPSGKRKIVRLNQNQIQGYDLLAQESTGKTSKLLSSNIETFQPAVSFFDNFRQNFMVILLKALASDYIPQSDRVLLIGWLDKDSGGISANLSIQNNKHVTLLEWEIPRRDTHSDALFFRSTL